MWKLAEEGVAIVLVGSFNPAIFQPRWIADQGLMRPEEGENAEIKTIARNLSDFSTDWFHLQVVQERLQFESTSPAHFNPLRDLAASLIELLPHTPVTALGMNRSYHFETGSTEEWHNFGHLLAPKEHWNKVLSGPGLRSMIMEGKRPVNVGSTIRIKIEPSARFAEGIYIHINEEFRPDGDTGALWARSRLIDHWESMLEYSNLVVEHFRDVRL